MYSKQEILVESREMLLEHVPCDLCGSEKYKIRYAKPDTWLGGSMYQFPVVECLGCGLVYVNPRPTYDGMAAFYPSDYHANRNGEEFIERYRRQRRYLPELTNKRVLDIGCAHGDFLHFLLETEQGVTAFGIDAFSRGVCDDKIKFTQESFTKNSYPDSFFDLITAWAVFEHLHEPLASFREASRVLRKGGVMVILVTNSESFYGKRAFVEDVPRHTYHYSKETLAKYGEASGLGLSGVDYCDDIFDGRGRGALTYGLATLFGFSWEKEMLGTLSIFSRVARSIGARLDGAVFDWHWEKRLGCSGVMVATYVKR